SRKKQEASAARATISFSGSDRFSRTTLPDPFCLDCVNPKRQTGANFVRPLTTPGAMVCGNSFMRRPPAWSISLESQGTLIVGYERQRFDECALRVLEKL